MNYWDELVINIKYISYVVLIFVSWIFYGTLVRWAYRKAIKDGSTYYVDRPPLGKKPE